MTNGIHVRSEVFLREDIEAILDGLEMAANGQPVSLNAVRRALHIEIPGGSGQNARLVESRYPRIVDVSRVIEAQP